jgi:hypothetical protein
MSVSADDFAALRERLEHSRATGAPFEHAWSVAVDAVTLTPGGRAAIEDTADAWKRAYQRRPATMQDKAAARFAAMFDAS